MMKVIQSTLTVKFDSQEEMKQYIPIFRKMGYAFEENDWFGTFEEPILKIKTLSNNRT